MTLPGFNGFFCRVSVVAVGREKLVGDFAKTEEGFEARGTLIVTFLKCGGEAEFFKLFVDGGVGSNQLRLGAGFDENGHDSVGVLDIRHHDVFFASDGGDGEMAGLISAYVSGDLYALAIYQV